MVGSPSGEHSTTDHGLTLGPKRVEGRPSPWAGLLRSRKFMILVLDVVMSLALYFVGKYAAASLFEDVKIAIAVLQPVFVALIGAIAYEDAAAKRGG